MNREQIFKSKIELLEEEIKHLQQEVNDAHDLLTKMKVPTNGVDADGNLGWGKRENLTLSQRITYLR